MTSRPTPTTPRSLVWATDIDVLPAGRVVERHDDHLVVRSPSNPTHYWGNLLLFDAPPSSGDRRRWEALFAAAFADQPESLRHRTFAWDVTDGSTGAMDGEFLGHDYDAELTTGLIAAAAEIRPHPRANPDVHVRALDPRADQPLWDEVTELWVALRDAERFPEEDHRAFTRARLADLRELFTAGRGAWLVALAGAEEVVGSCGVVVTGGRGRFQQVATAPAHRRRGICRRLVVDAARHAALHHGARRLVIAADPEYHALGIYESLGFRPMERVTGVCRPPARTGP